MDTNGKYRVLIVDDEPDICDILSYNLTKEGYSVGTANSAEEALSCKPASFDLILLDVMMGKISGFRLASMLKEDPATASIPIIFLTAKDTEDDTVTGLEIGADDYITKPFSIREVLARVQVVLRRYEKTPEETLSFKGLVMNPARKSLSVDGKNVDLTRIEFEILHLLLSSPGTVFSRQDLIAAVWPKDVEILDRTVDVNITRLRKKLAPYSACIHTRSGYGYYLGE